MSLAPGSSIGPYVVLGPIGAGGMGEVLKARDTRLNRTVAIKLLTADAGDAAARKRLLREAQAASALNHPNIVTAYDILSLDDRDMIVMEYVEGTTLAERIARKPLPLADVLHYAIQIAGALSAAHASGIIHRDVKPANVMVTGARIAKVLDFGLAQVEPTPGPEGETATMTAEGVIAGTFLYMSPEQAEGKKVDARSDIFAFGSLLYEMLAGRPAFPGDSRLAILTAILHRDPPPLSGLRPDVPPHLEKLVQRCLRKDPEFRLQSMHDVRLLLEDPLDPPSVTPAPASPSRTWLKLLLATALSLAAGVLLASFWLPSPDADLSSYRLTPFATEAGMENSPAWSPDGRTLAYEFEVEGITQIYARGLDASSGTLLTNSPDACYLPFWSPDGNQIYYGSRAQLWSVSPAGGLPRLVLPGVLTATISPNGKTLVFARGNIGDVHLMTASPLDAPPQPYSLGPFAGKLAQITVPQFSPDGSKIAVAISRRTANVDPELWILPFPSGAPVRVPVHLPGRLSGSQRPSWMPDGRRLIIGVDGHLYSVDTQRGDLHTITATTATEVQPAVSPDGRRIAFSAGTDDADILQVSFDTGLSKPLLATSRSESSPAWSPLHSQYAYVTTATGLPEIWLRNVPDNGARPLVRQDAATPWYDLEKLRFSPDGSRLSYDLYGARHQIAISSVAGGPPMFPDHESTDQHGLSWSPDGNWIAYRRLNGAKWELVKRPLGGGEPVWLDDTGQGGSETDWSPSGEWIAHVKANALHVVSADGARHVAIQSAPTPAFGFSRDSRTLYTVRRNAARKWELAAFEVPSGREQKVVPLDVPVAARVTAFSPNPDGKTWITSIAQSHFDIWFLEGFAPPRRRLF